MKDIKENRPGPTESDHRVNTGISRGAEIELTVDGQPIRAYEGETVAAAILATGRRALRTTSETGEMRGLYCGIGICFDCVMIIDDIPNVRTCQTFVENGMVVESQKGEGKWSVKI